MTLANLRALLAPGGQLVLLEATTRERFSDLTVGFTPGWWAFDDTDLRPDYALLSRGGWLAHAARRLRVRRRRRARRAVAGDDLALRREAVVVASAPTARRAVAAAARTQPWALVGDGPLADAVAGALTAPATPWPGCRAGDRAAVGAAVTPARPGRRRRRRRAAPAPTPIGRPMAMLRRHEARTATVLAAVQGVLDAPRGAADLVRDAGRPGRRRRPRDRSRGGHRLGRQPRRRAGAPRAAVPAHRRRRRGDGRRRRPRSSPSCTHPDPDEPQVAWRGGRPLRAPARAVGGAPDGHARARPRRQLRRERRPARPRPARRRVARRPRRPAPRAVRAVRPRRRGTTAAIERLAGVGASSWWSSRPTPPSTPTSAASWPRAAALAPLRGVIHSAGALADAALVRQDWAHFATGVRRQGLRHGARSLRHVDVDAARLPRALRLRRRRRWLDGPGQPRRRQRLPRRRRPPPRAAAGVPGRQHRLGGVDRCRCRRRSRHRRVARRVLARAGPRRARARASRAAAARRRAPDPGPGPLARLERRRRAASPLAPRRRSTATCSTPVVRRRPRSPTTAAAGGPTLRGAAGRLPEAAAPPRRCATRCAGLAARVLDVDDVEQHRGRPAAARPRPRLADGGRAAQPARRAPSAPSCRRRCCSSTPASAPSSITCSPSTWPTPAPSRPTPDRGPTAPAVRAPAPVADAGAGHADVDEIAAALAAAPRPARRQDAPMSDATSRLRRAARSGPSARSTRWRRRLEAGERAPARADRHRRHGLPLPRRRRTTPTRSGSCC